MNNHMKIKCHHCQHMYDAQGNQHAECPYCAEFLEVSQNTVFTDSDSTGLARDYAAMLRDSGTSGSCLPMYIDGVDGYFEPMVPGEIALVHARTTNGKTMFGDAWMHRHAEALRVRTGPNSDTYTLKIDYENYVEHLKLAQLVRMSKMDVRQSDLLDGTVDMEDVVQPLLNVLVYNNIITIAVSLKQPQYYDKLTVDYLCRMVEWMQKGGLFGRKIKFSAFFMDYLQSVPLAVRSKFSSRSEQKNHVISQNFNELYKLSGTIGAPGVVLAQARDILKAPKTLCIPGRTEVAGASEPGMKANRVIPLWMPKTDFPEEAELGTAIDHEFGNTRLSYRVTNNLQMMRVDKQRSALGSPAGKVFPLLWNYSDGSVRYVKDTVGAPRTQQRASNGSKFSF